MVRFILFFMGMICGGCAHYQSGVGATNVVQSVYIEPVKNSSLCPKASGSLTAQLTKTIQQSTPLKLARKNEANAHLQIEIVDYSQKNSTYDPKDTSSVLSLNLRVVAECTLIDKEGHFLLEHQRVEASMDLEKQSNFLSLRDQAIPQLMERLARKIGALLVNIW
ncbi:MAG: LPS assembly lipoprotein LptE [Puniceicoccales bacterium]|jgi:hypothetical protein|nr:LPS assembly lipoprotein LptE [Puniceicoccales bacterium]